MNPTYIGGKYVNVIGHGRLWAVTEIETKALRVVVDGRHYYLRTVAGPRDFRTNYPTLAFELGAALN